MNNYRNKIQSTESNDNLNSNNRTENNSAEDQKNSLNKRIIILIAVAVILIAIIVGVFIFKKIWDQNKGKSNLPGNNALSKKEALKAFESNFKISSKTNNLNQILMKSYLKHISFSNGVESTTLSVFTKSKFDLYTLNESYAGEDSKEFYSRKFSTVITINSMCTDFSVNKTDCELEKYLDLNVKNKNLRNIEEKVQEVIKEAILPICIIEHTNTNIIISVTCPETLSSNLKEDIILAFQSIKPESFKGIIDDESVAGTSITEKDNKKYIDSFVKGCDDYDGDPLLNETCEVTKNIVTDLEGNLISMKQNSTKEIIEDEDHKTNKIKTFYIEDISNSENFDSKNYKKNLDNVFELIKPYMKKEEKISSNSFNEILEDLMKGDSNTTNIYRRLVEEEKTDNTGIFEYKIFSKKIYDINIELNSKNVFGLEYGSNSAIITSLKTGKKTNEISYSESNTNLNETINKFISLSKAANIKASVLQEELNEPILELRNNIDSNINDLNNLLSFIDLSPIFDSTLAISGLSKMLYTLVSSSRNLYSNLKKINNEISYSIKDYKNNLKDAVSSFLAESHQLLFYIFSNLTEL